MQGNYGSIPATATTASDTSVTATATAILGKQFQIIGFDGSSSDQAVKVELKFGSTVMATMHGGMAVPTGRAFNPDCAPVTGTNVTVTVVTTPAASGQCDANLYYRIIN